MTAIRKGSVKHNSLHSEAAVAVPHIYLLTAPTAGFLSFPWAGDCDFLADMGV